MERILFKSKLHRGTITEADLNYEGSLTLDPELMEAADLLPYEKVQVVNINTGSRLETYVIKGEPGSKTICLNGAAARLGAVGDKVIIISYATMREDEARDFHPKAVQLDDENNIVSVSSS